VMSKGQHKGQVLTERFDRHVDLAAAGVYFLSSSSFALTDASISS
jgi:hypothetical protein